MPTLPAAACRIPTCPRRSSYRGLCADHARLKERERGTRTERGYGPYWQARRLEYLAAHPFCDACPALATEPDHIITVKEGLRRGWSEVDIHSDRNLRPKCKRHHSQRTARDQSHWSTKKTSRVALEARCCTGARPRDDHHNWG
jgi:5-methylcytosine-specific restriction protein A